MCCNKRYTSVMCGILVRMSVTCGAIDHKTVTCGAMDHTSVICGATDHTFVICGAIDHTSVIFCAMDRMSVIIIIIYHDFLPPLRMGTILGSHVKSDNTHTIINIHALAHILDICALVFSSCALFTVYSNRTL